MNKYYSQYLNTLNNEVIPFWLKPLKQFKKTGELLDLGANQGRNDALLKHFLALMDYGKGLNTEEKIESIRLINNFLFKEPLSEKELDSTVLRQSLIEEKEKQITASKSCLEERIANKILEKYNIINVGGVFYIYTGKYYREVKEVQEIERLIHFEYSENLKEHQRKEVIKFLELKSWVPAEKVNKEWNEIVFENGIYNISTDKLLPHDIKKYNTTFVPQTYYPNAEYSGAIDGFFTELCKEVKDTYPDKTIWCYTGFKYEEVKELDIMNYIDVLLDGEFIQELADEKIKWVGSSNQRVIDVKKTKEKGEIVLHS